MSLSGDSFDIQDHFGVLRYRIKGKFLSLRERKTLSDASGNLLYQMRDSLPTLHGRQLISNAAGAPVVVIRQKSFIPLMGGTSEIKIWRGSEENGKPWLSCKAKGGRNNFIITEVATRRRFCFVERDRLNFDNIVWGKDTYVANVLPGTDAALMIMVVVAIDEIYHEGHSSFHKVGKLAIKQTILNM